MSKHEYEIQQIEARYRRESDSDQNWIYIGIDTQRSGMFKIGLTTRELDTRHSSSQNPFYTLLAAFKVRVDIDEKKVKEIEQSLIREIARSCQLINHYSGKSSEWFYGNPLDMKDFVNDFLYQNYSYEMNCYYCNIRERGIVLGWENERYLYNKPKNLYQMTDTTTQPENPDCYNYGGCGDESCTNCSSNWHLKSR